jgi:hypothetical protein
MATDLAAANRRALAASWGVTPGRAFEIPLTVDATGAFPVLRMARGDGAWISLNSPRAPHREARHLLQGIDLDSATAVVVVGAGLGYVLEELEAAGASPPAVALEPCAGFLDACLGRKDWTSAIAAQRLLFSCGPDFAELSAAGASHPDLFLAPAILVPPVIARELPAFVEAAQARLERIRSGARANAEARRRFAAPYLLNTLANRPVLEREADVDALDGAAAGLPAIVVGAGPSLDSAIEGLREAASRGVLVATDTAARPLLGSGIVPHIIVSVDPTDVNGRHLLELPDERPVLVGEASLWPRAFDEFAGRAFLFRVGRHHPWPWLEAGGLGVGTLRAWGSVITSAVDLALRLGCPRVALVGADCAAVNGQPYARGTTFEAAWMSRVLAGRPLPDVWRAIVSAWGGPCERDAAGRLIETGPHLLAFRDWLLEEGRRHAGLLFNASGQGLLAGEGVVPIALAEFTAAFGLDASGLSDALHRRHHAARRTAARRPLPPVPDAWRAVLEEGGLDPELGAGVAGRGRSAWMERERTRTPVVGPMGEAAAVLDAAVRGRPAPAWAIPALVDVPAALRAPYGERLLPKLLSVRGGNPTRSWLPSQADGLSPRDRALLARVETSAAAAMSQSVTALPAGEPPLCVWPGIRTRGHLDEPVALAATLVILAAELDTIGGGDSRLAALALASMRGLAAAVDPHHPSSPIDAIGLRLAIAYGASRAGGMLPVSAAGLFRALAGTAFTGRISPTAVGWTAEIDRDRPAGALRVSCHRPGHSIPRRESVHIGPRRLVAPGACLSARSAGASARVTTLLGRATWAIDEDGRASLVASWPEPVLGETSLGESGLVAWSPAGSPRLWFRRDSDAGVRTIALPFAPAVAHAMDGRVYLAGVSGGVWSWDPVRGTERVADCEPIRGLHPEAGGLRLDPVQLSHTGATTAVPLRRAWRLRLPSGELEPIALDERGPTWSIARSASGWIARTFPCAGSVEIESPSGRLFTLICPFPFSAAWAGASLVVTCTTAGEVWFYGRLAAMLERLPAGGR